MIGASNPWKRPKVDLENNPFIDWSKFEFNAREPKWNVDNRRRDYGLDEPAWGRVIHRIMDKIEMYEHLLEHGKNLPDFNSTYCEEKLAMWKERLTQARYN